MFLCLVHSNLSRFSIQNKCVKLSGQTLRNLEIFKNQVCNQQSECVWSYGGALQMTCNFTTSVVNSPVFMVWLLHCTHIATELTLKMLRFSEVPLQLNDVIDWHTAHGVIITTEITLKTSFSKIPLQLWSIRHAAHRNEDRRNEECYQWKFYYLISFTDQWKWEILLILGH